MLKIFTPESGLAEGRPSALRRHSIEREQACEVCGCHDVQLVAVEDRQTEPLPTAICVHCGLISHFVVPSDEELALYYRMSYRRDYHGEATPSARRILKAWQCGQTIFRQLAPHLHPGDQVFEVGAGLGCTVKAFELAGYAASGIEPGQTFADFAHHQVHAQVESMRLEDMPRQPKYDCILLVHVIEHLNAPRRSLSHIRSLLHEGGRLYVECPNIAAPHAAPGKMFHYAHVYNFTHRTLAMLGRVCGLRVVHRFSSDRDRNLRVLFECARPAGQFTDPEGYLEAIAAVKRYGTLSYHIRPSYLAQRLSALTRQLTCRVTARRRVNRILQTCTRHAAHGAVPAARRMAS